MKPATSENPGASPTAIQHHYDVGNEFYRAWLDPTLCYSGAMFAEEDSLEEAQIRKIEHHIRESRASKKDRVLDVGCGWGAVLKRLVEVHGVGSAVGLTLSRAQSERIATFHDPRIDVRLESWSDHMPEAPYDAVISIGAFEHFARLEYSDERKIKGYRSFFQACHEWLKPRGRLSLQTFAYGSRRPRAAVRDTAGTRFLAGEIFPETDPPRLADIVAAIEGIFEIEALRNDRRDYARTCLIWLQNLKANRKRVVELASEQVVARYERYLKLSALGFETGNLALLRITMCRIDAHMR